MEAEALTERRQPGARRGTRARAIARTLASAAFVLLIVGITYFAILVLLTHYGGSQERAVAFVELADFLSGGGAWYRDARTYGGSALILAILSILFGVHPLARITLPISGAVFLVLQFYGEELRELLTIWARLGG